MTEMVALEKLLCRSAPWPWFGRRYVVPWAMQGIEPSGHGLEIGGGSGVMAAQLLAMFPELKLTVTDLDRSMFADAPKDLARSGDRVQVEVADATRLPFPDGSFDYVFSFISLPVDRSMLTTGRGGFVVRFRLRKQLT